MLIALDWGTTHLRAYRMDDDGRVTGEVVSPNGILSVPDGDFDTVFESAVGAWLDSSNAAILACGMIASRQGWVEAPYLDCPAGVEELAARLTPLTTRRGWRLWFVPGVTRTGEDGVPDVARGEETQIVGDAATGAERDVLYVLPGTHSKWAIVRQGRIAWFATFMTGEVFAVLSRHSILGRLMQEDAEDEAAFLRGAAYARRSGTSCGGLLKRLFSARTLALFGKLEPSEVRSYLSGLLIGAEVEEALACIGDLASGAPREVAIIGGAGLSAAYAAALRARGVACDPRPQDVTARGLFRIAVAAGLLK